MYIYHLISYKQCSLLFSSLLPQVLMYIYHLIPYKQCSLLCFSPFYHRNCCVIKIDVSPFHQKQADLLVLSQYSMAENWNVISQYDTGNSHMRFCTQHPSSRMRNEPSHWTDAVGSAASLGPRQLSPWTGRCEPWSNPAFHWQSVSYKEKQKQRTNVK